MNDIELFFKYLTKNNIPSWLVMIGVIFYFIVRMYKYLFSEKINERRNYLHSRSLQVESYFREIGNDDLQEIFSFWINMLIDQENLFKQLTESQLDRYDYLMNNPDEKRTIEDEDIIEVFKSQQIIFNDKIMKTIECGSEKTVKLVSLYQSDIYNGNNDIPYRELAYLSMIISSLKFDFSGYEIDSLYLIKLKVGRFDESKFKNQLKLISKMIK